MSNTKCLPCETHTNMEEPVATESVGAPSTQEQQSVEKKPWERAWNLQELKDGVHEWTLAADAGLLLYLQEFSGRLLSKTKEIGNAVDQLVLDLSTADVSLHNTFNEFLMLSHNQFVENRVYEDDEVLADESTGDQNPPEKEELSYEEREAILVPKYSSAVSLGMEALTEYERYHAPPKAVDEYGSEAGESESDEEEKGSESDGEKEVKDTEKQASKESDSPLPEIVDEWNKPPLPFVIGTREFIEDEFCGLYVEEEVMSDVEESESDDEDEDVEDEGDENKEDNEEGDEESSDMFSDSEEGMSDEEGDEEPITKRKKKKQKDAVEEQQVDGSDDDNLFGADSDSDDPFADLLSSVTKQAKKRKPKGGQAVLPGASGLFGDAEEDEEGKDEDETEGKSEAEEETDEEAQEPELSDRAARNGEVTKSQSSAAASKTLFDDSDEEDDGLFTSSKKNEQSSSEGLFADETPKKDSKKKAPKFGKSVLPIGTRSSLFDDEEDDDDHADLFGNDTSTAKSKKSKVDQTSVTSSKREQSYGKALAGESLFDVSDDEGDSLFSSSEPSNSAKATKSVAVSGASLFDDDDDDDDSIFASIEVKSKSSILDESASAQPTKKPMQPPKFGTQVLPSPGAASLFEDDDNDSSIEVSKQLPAANDSKAKSLLGDDIPKKSSSKATSSGLFVEDESNTSSLFDDDDDDMQKADVSKSTSSGLFGDSDEDDIFGASPKVQKAEDDDVFGSKSKSTDVFRDAAEDKQADKKPEKTEQPSSNLPANKKKDSNDLFDFDDDNDDIFSSLSTGASDLFGDEKSSSSPLPAKVDSVVTSTPKNKNQKVEGIFDSVDEEDIFAPQQQQQQRAKPKQPTLDTAKPAKGNRISHLQRQMSIDPTRLLPGKYVNYFLSVAKSPVDAAPAPPTSSTEPAMREEATASGPPPKLIHFTKTRPLRTGRRLPSRARKAANRQRPVPKTKVPTVNEKVSSTDHFQRATLAFDDIPEFDGSNVLDSSAQPPSPSSKPLASAKQKSGLFDDDVDDFFGSLQGSSQEKSDLASLQSDDIVGPGNNSKQANHPFSETEATPNNDRKRDGRAVDADTATNSFPPLDKSTQSSPSEELPAGLPKAKPTSLSKAKTKTKTEGVDLFKDLFVEAPVSTAKKSQAPSTRGTDKASKSNKALFDDLFADAGVSTRKSTPIKKATAKSKPKKAVVSLFD